MKEAKTIQLILFLAFFTVAVMFHLELRSNAENSVIIQNQEAKIDSLETEIMIVRGVLEGQLMNK